MVRVNLEVPEEKKEKWQRAADEHPQGNGNLSALIRYAVEKELSDGGSGGNESEEVLKKLGELGDSISQVHERMDSVENRLSSLESETTTEPEIEELKGEVFDLLPDEEPGSMEWKDEKNSLEQQLGVDELDVSEEYHGWRGTIPGLSEGLDVPEYVVEKCIERLQENTSLIRTTEYADEKRFYKVI